MLMSKAARIIAASAYTFVPFYERAESPHVVGPTLRAWGISARARMSWRCPFPSSAGRARSATCSRWGRRRAS